MKRSRTQQADREQRRRESDVDHYLEQSIREERERIYVEPGSTATRALEKLKGRVTTLVTARGGQAGGAVKSKATVREGWNSIVSHIRWNLGLTYVMGSIVLIFLLVSQVSDESPSVAAFNETKQSPTGSTTAMGTLPANEYVQNQMVSVTYALR